MIRAARAILWKDLRIELRTRESAPAMALFSLTVFVLFHFGLRRNSIDGALASGVLWVTVLLAAVLGGVDPNGGFGKVLGLFLSLILLQIISTGFNLLGFSPHLTQAIWGAIMILAIAIALVRDRWVARLWLGKTLK